MKRTILTPSETSAILNKIHIDSVFNIKEIRNILNTQILLEFDTSNTIPYFRDLYERRLVWIKENEQSNKYYHKSKST